MINANDKDKKFNIRESIEKDKNRINMTKKIKDDSVKHKEVQPKIVNKYEAILEKALSYSINDMIFEKDVPTIIDESLASTLLLTGLFKIKALIK